MQESERKRISKFLSLVLRHNPGRVGIQLDAQGWVDIAALLDGCRSHGKSISRKQLDEVVATSDKQRYAVSDDGMRIRANQGHSVEVDLGYEPASPPDRLFHGTPERNVESIRQTGLEKRSRHHVHLSPDRETAHRVGSRHGRPAILEVRSGDMAREGHVFFLSANGVWLTDSVPAHFIDFPP